MSEKGLDDISLSWDNDKQKMLKWLEMESTTRIRRMVDPSSFRINGNHIFCDNIV